MKTRVLASPWVKAHLTNETEEAIKLLCDDVWKEASVLFAAEREAKMKSGKSAPKGMQRYLNEVITHRMDWRCRIFLQGKNMDKGHVQTSNELRIRYS